MHPRQEEKKQKKKEWTQTRAMVEAKSKLRCFVIYKGLSCVNVNIRTIAFRMS